MKTPAVPVEVQKIVESIVEDFNKKHLRPHGRYVTQWANKNLFIGFSSGGKASPRCRLTYTGSLDDWAFAIFKFSTETYDTDDWMFEGEEHVDGTIEGALEAVLKAYPD